MIRGQVIVIFTEADYEQIKFIVRSREKLKGEWDRISASETERITGFQAEYAVKTYLGEEAEIDENNYEKGAGNCDVWFRNKKFSVRSTEKLENNLLVRPGEEEGIDGFILTISRPRVVKMVGWTSVNKFMKESEVRDPQNLGKPCRIMWKGKLDNIATIFYE